jgi:Zn-dependent peptidase ImmA (M78 family)
MTATALSPARPMIVGRRVSSAPRRAFVRRTVAELRLRHPELRGTPTLIGVLAVCAREEIRVRKAKLPRSDYAQALLIPCPPYLRFISINRELPRTFMLETLLHELAHFALGHLTPETVERDRVAPPRPWNDPPTRLELQQEAEAELAAALLLGPERVAIAARERARYDPPDPAKVAA